MSQGTLIEKTSYDLGLRIAANIPTSGIPLNVQEWYLANPHLIPEALCRGFILPQKESAGEKKSVARAKISPTPAVFKATDIDLAMWIAKSEEFAEKYLGVKISLRERFAIPETLLWQSVIPVFDPGGEFDNRKAIELLKALGFTVHEEVDVMQYSGSAVGMEPTLHFIHNSVRPDEDTMKMSPDKLVKTGKNWLNLRGYALAFGLYHFVTKNHLDPETFTWFPGNRLPSGEVAGGDWYPVSRKVGFYWSSARYEGPYGGARLAMPVPLII